MIFAAPWVLLALLGLPLLWRLLRVTPPAPRTERFPAIRLLAGLTAAAETPARTPLWLLALRMSAAALVIVAIARPVLDAAGALPGAGPVLLVIDDGWASAADWPRRMQAAGAALDRAERAGRPVALLATAPGLDAAAPRVTPAMPAVDLRAKLAALRPKPWPPDRAAAAAALAGFSGAAVYVGDGVAHGPDFAAFADALAAVGPVDELCCAEREPAGRVLAPPRAEAERLVARVLQVPQAGPTTAAVLAQTGDGRSLARAEVAIPAGEAAGEARIDLPPELRRRLARLVLDGPPSAAGVALLDETWRRRPVGLTAGDQAAAEAPLIGPLFYLRRALSPDAELREGSLKEILSRDVSAIVLADRPLPAGPERDALAAWVERGGLLIRFAGPRMAEQSMDEADPLLPVTLLEGDRALGGALSWSKPARLAAFPEQSPFAGLAVPDDVLVTRQVLAQPSAELPGHTWASLADGTPLVTEATRGAGRIVLFHATANAEWSNLPLSGLFVEMMRRLVALSEGVAASGSQAQLSPAETLDGFGALSSPPPGAASLPADAIAAAAASAKHPPGLYGPESDRQVLNLGQNLPPPDAAPPVRGATLEPLGAAAPERAIGPWMLAFGVLLLAADLLVSLALRGLLRRPASARLAALGLLAVVAAAPAQALERDIPPALATRLASIVTGDAQADAVARAGLEGLSDFVNRRTAATLVEPDAVVPGRDDLSFYPLLYWPVGADAAAPSAEAVAALNDYMSRGGIVLIDTRGSGADGAGGGAGFAPGADAALRRVTQGLSIPPLAMLTTDHVLSRAFYLMQDFPGRFAGEPVWVQRDQDRANDSVSPVILGAADWASAWATDANGANPYAVMPGGARQRTMAYRFGVNLVMYALTGNYKGDQVHVPAILERLGQ